MTSDKYLDFVIWGCLICPANLFRMDLIELFKTAAGQCLKIQIFRDMVGYFFYLFDNFATDKPFAEPQRARRIGDDRWMVPSKRVERSSAKELQAEKCCQGFVQGCDDQ